MTAREQLFFLLKEFSEGKYTVPSFCDAFEDVFFPDIPRDELNYHEIDLFEKLGEIIARYTPYEDDLRKYPGVYKSETEVKSAIKFVLSELTNNSVQ